MPRVFTRCHTASAVIARFKRAIQYPPTLEGTTSDVHFAQGILDRPVKPGDDSKTVCNT
jgi:hypothetical protein